MKLGQSLPINPKMHQYVILIPQCCVFLILKECKFWLIWDKFYFQIDCKISIFWTWDFVFILVVISVVLVTKHNARVGWVLLITVCFITNDPHDHLYKISYWEALWRKVHSIFSCRVLSRWLMLLYLTTQYLHLFITSKYFVLLWEIFDILNRLSMLSYYVVKL